MEYEARAKIQTIQNYECILIRVSFNMKSGGFRILTVIVSGDRQRQLFCRILKRILFVNTALRVTGKEGTKVMFCYPVRKNGAPFRIENLGR